MRTFLVAALIVGAVAYDEAKARPLNKVIKLLKDMGENLIAEAEADEKIFNKMACWCNTNSAEKTTAIAEAEASITDLSNTVNANTKKAASLKKQIETLEASLKKQIDSLNRASEIRRGELEAFNAKSLDTKETIRALDSASTILGKHNFMQMPQIRAALVAGMEAGFEAAPEDAKVVSALIQGPIGDGAYASQSGQIAGIIGSMNDNFKANQKSAQDEEDSKAKAFGEMKATSQESIAATRERIENKSEERAVAMRKGSSAQNEWDATQTTLGDDKKFLADLEMRCQNADQENTNRKKLRAEEQKAVSQALDVLTSDEAHDSFGKSFNFVQIESSVSQHRREEASRVLRDAGNTLNKPILSALAMSVRLDAFTKVKKAMDDMVAQLLVEKQDEIKHKAYCVEALFENSKATKLKTNENEDFNSQAEASKSDSEKLAAQIEHLEEEMEEIRKQMKLAGDNRSKQNLEFHQNIKDQRASKKLMANALNILKGFYSKEHAATKVGGANVVLTQQPEGFGSYKKQASGGPVAMLETIIGEVDVEIAEMVNAEKDAQTAYEEFHMDSNEALATKTDLASTKTAQKADADEDFNDATQGVENTQTELDQMAATAEALHGECDFHLKNFDLRQKARDQEVNAIRNAKSILGGSMQGSAFLQRRA